MECIYAVDSNNGLSKNGNIPWKSKVDMDFFVKTTINHVVVMGKTTYFSIPEKFRPLKNRLNIVLTSHPELYENKETHPNVIFTQSLHMYQEILSNKEKYTDKYDFLKKDFSVFCIGGKNVYEQMINLAEKVWVTYFKKNYECDLFMDNVELLSSTAFSQKIFAENDELTIIEYTRQFPGGDALRNE
jgi:dihydrofolate reductase